MKPIYPLLNLERQVDGSYSVVTKLTAMQASPIIRRFDRARRAAHVVYSIRIWDAIKQRDAERLFHLRCKRSHALMLVDWFSRSSVIQTGFIRRFRHRH